MLANFICDLIFFLRINFVIEEYDFQFFYVHFIAHRKKSIKIKLPRLFTPSFTNFDRCEYSKTNCLLADVNKAVLRLAVYYQSRVSKDSNEMLNI